MRSQEYGDCMHADATPRNPIDGNAPSRAEQLAYSVASAAKVLELGERTVWDLVKRGDIESFKIGASRRIRRAALDAFIERAQADATHPPAGPSSPPPPPGPKNVSRSGYAA